MTPIHWSRRALEDWRCSMLFMAKRNTTYAADVAAAVEHKLELLAANPQMGIKVPGHRRLLATYVRRGVLWIYYLPGPGEATIARIKPAPTRVFNPTIDF